MNILSYTHLDKYGTVGAALCPHLLLGLCVEEVDALSDVPSHTLNRRVSIHGAELPQAETIVILRGGLCEAVHEDVWRLGMKFLLMSNANICNTSKCFYRAG